MVIVVNFDLICIQQVIHQRLAWLRFLIQEQIGMRCESILRDHHAEWDPALHHAFLKLSREGTVPVSAFNRWLEQDFQFVKAFRDFAEYVLSCAPAVDQEVLRGGVEALDDELSWFKDKIFERALDAAAAQLSVTSAYCDFMRGLRGRPYPVLAAAFFAIEYVYNQAWAGVMGGDSRYQEFAERWGSADFSTYVEQLRSHADRALQATSTDVQREAEEVVGRNIPRLEVRFWQMALE